MRKIMVTGLAMAVMSPLAITASIAGEQKKAVETPGYIYGKQECPERQPAHKEKTGETAKSPETAPVGPEPVFFGF